jgi:competence protein ComEC
METPAFAEDCARAAIIVTPLFAPSGCAAGLIIDRDKLRQTGAVTIDIGEHGMQVRSARAADEDRPWSPAPKRGWSRTGAPKFAPKDQGPRAPSQAADPDDTIESLGGDASPLE